MPLGGVPATTCLKHPAVRRFQVVSLPKPSAVALFHQMPIQRYRLLRDGRPGKMLFHPPPAGRAHGFGLLRIG